MKLRRNGLAYRLLVKLAYPYTEKEAIQAGFLPHPRTAKNKPKFWQILNPEYHRSELRREQEKHRRDIKKLEKQIADIRDMHQSAAEETTEKLDSVLNITRNAIKEAEETTEKSARLNATAQQIIKQFNVSVDANVYGKSWAVLSMAGKQTYVRFVELNTTDIRSIEQFLKQFEGANLALDAPRNIERLIF